MDLKKQENIIDMAIDVILGVTYKNAAIEYDFSSGERVRQNLSKLFRQMKHTIILKQYSFDFHLLDSPNDDIKYKRNNIETWIQALYEYKKIINKNFK